MRRAQGRYLCIEQRCNVFDLSSHEGVNGLSRISEYPQCPNVLTDLDQKLGLSDIHVLVFVYKYVFDLRLMFLCKMVPKFKHLGEAKKTSVAKAPIKPSAKSS
ncbi:hypothetical protein PCO31111_02447 [Pandoraea communis]|uniref:Uncharacterized protein n=1 Tax=Pandoraea communis TaxID=2508297 RepID=A0A5E4V6B4_9BURK|nr:hypothetical protein PCO31111_02447 [Pandoraea communis]